MAHDSSNIQCDKNSSDLGTWPCTCDELVYRLKKRAEIRRAIPGRKSVQEGKPDRMADLLDEAALRIYSLEQAIKKHRSATGHDLCWENDEELWSVLGDGVELDHTPPAWCEFMTKCAEYRKSRETVKKVCECGGKREGCNVHTTDRCYHDCRLEPPHYHV